MLLNSRVFRLLGLVVVVAALVCLICCRGSSMSGSKATNAIKAQTIIFVSSGQELRVGNVQLSVEGHDSFGVGAPPPSAVYVFLDLVGISPDDARNLKQQGVVAGGAYLKTDGGLKFIENVDGLTREQIEAKFGMDPPISDEDLGIIYYGSFEQVKSLVTGKPSLLSRKTSSGDPLLHLALVEPRKAVVEFLLDKGIDVNGKDDFGNTALHKLASETCSGCTMSEADRIAFAQLLLDKGADINSKNSFGDSPLKMANRNAHKGLAAWLRRHGGHE